MNASITPNYKDSLNMAAALIILITGIVGTISNALIIYIFIHTSSERTSFNMICVVRAVGNFIILAWAFLATFLPITLIGDSPFGPLYETVVIGIANSIYSGIQNTGILIGLNRFFAIFFPKHYSTIFGIKGTFLALSIIVTHRTVKSVFELIHFLPLECWMVYMSSDLTWYPSTKPICEEDDNGFDTSTIFLLVMIFLNAATFTKIYFFYKSTGLDVKERKEKIRKNRSLFLQTFVQDNITVLDMVFTFKLNSLSTDRAWTFLCGTVIWECVHSFDGLIMVMFNQRLSFIKKVLFSSTANPSVAVQEKMTGSTVRNNPPPVS